MKRLMIAILASALVGSAVSAVRADDSGWGTDFAKAKELAAQKKVPILVVFSGSDWCGWCKKLDREVWSQPEFKDYAKDNVVLFLADFPRGKELEAKTAAQNKDLAASYSVEGFPTVLLVDGEGKELARTGYKPGGAEKYVEHLKGLVKVPRK